MSIRGNGPFGLGARETEAAGGAGTRHARREEAEIVFAISQRELGGETSLITVEGELDLASAPNLKWTLNDAIRSGARHLVVDLGPVTFIDSTALGVLVGVHRALRPGCRLALAGADAEVLNIFELTGLDSTFDMFSTLDEALAWVRGSEAATG
jgi:anti-sigma B factor antagonist